MKVKNLEIEKNDFSFGLKPKSIDIRTNTVALVGRNGSGKSRVLNYVYEVISDFKNRSLREVSNIPSSLQIKLNQYAQFVRNNSRNMSAVNKRIDEMSTQFSQYSILIKGHDVSNLTKNISSIENSYESFLDSQSEEPLNEISALNDSALQYFYNIPNRLAFEDWKYRDNKKSLYNTKAYREYKSIQRLVKELIGKEIKWEIDDSKVTFKGSEGFGGVLGKWYLEDWLFDFSKLSDGEKPLFSYALLLHLNSSMSSSKLANSIILIDEPEQHLHPEAQIGLINSLRNRISEKGQLWFATHSLTILSELDYREIFILENGTIKTPSSNSISNSIEVLFGLSEKAEKMRNFISRAYNWSYTNFIMQSFEKPETIETSNPSDPQFQLFIQVLASQTEIKILDYGCGKGRISKLLNSIQYAKLKYSIDGFDINNDNETVLNKSFYDKLILTDKHQFKQEYNYVILSNTLHEIDPDNWETVFKNIKNSLLDDGHLIFIEDLELPKGEKIERFGFLTLNEIELGTLLNCKPIRLYSSEKKYFDRILCATISKQDIKKITQKRIVQTLLKTKARAWNNSKELRKNGSIKNARLKAFYDSLFINANLAIEYYENQK